MQIRLRLILIVIALVSSTVAWSKAANDTISEVDSVVIPARPKAPFLSNMVFQFDNRTERYYDVRGRMNGLKIGLEFYKRLRVGVGLYGNNDFYRIEPPQGVDSIFRTARFNYATLFGEIVVFRNFNWEVSVAGAMGSGAIQANTYNALGSLPEFVRLDTINDVEVFDIGLTGYYKVFPWLGLGAGVGTRQVQNLADGNLRSAFNDPYIDFKLKVFLGYAYRGIFKPQTIEAERAYYQYRKQKRLNYLRTTFHR